jgi:hypothetical protein
LTVGHCPSKSMTFFIIKSWSFCSVSFSSAVHGQRLVWTLVSGYRTAAKRNNICRVCELLWSVHDATKINLGTWQIRRLFFYVFLLQVCKMWLAYNMWNFLFCLNAAVLCCIWIEVNRWIYLKEHMHSNSPVLEKCLKGLSWANCGERMWPFANSSPLSNILAKNLRLTLSQKKLLKFFFAKIERKKILQVKQSFFYERDCQIYIVM